MLIEVKKLANGFLIAPPKEMPMFVRDVKDMAEVITQLCADDVEMKEYLNGETKKERKHRRKSRRSRSNKAWTEDEDVKLMELVEAKETFGKIALELSRTVSAARQRASTLGLTHKETVTQ